ncbi:hypothetical protein AYJ00_10905 [Shewanella algae]|uniref:hypothetical protein n=1 Tax=Shewanella algae TaxID=38313 RepID=UPI001183670A|nr:hypothetical protein [Shewanella algae]TVL62844.1 hypothetical protein AYJ00_10905 [Shewanella algae]
MYHFDDELTSGFATFEELEQERQDFMARLRRSQEIDEQVENELKQMQRVIANLEAAVLELDPEYDQRHLKVCMGKFTELIKRGIKIRAGSDPDKPAYRPNLFTHTSDDDPFMVDDEFNE